MALSGQTAVVTGAAMGIGRAVTELLLQHGAMVTGHSAGNVCQLVEI